MIDDISRSLMKLLINELGPLIRSLILTKKMIDKLMIRIPKPDQQKLTILADNLVKFDEIEDGMRIIPYKF